MSIWVIMDTFKSDDIMKSPKTQFQHSGDVRVIMTSKRRQYHYKRQSYTNLKSQNSTALSLIGYDFGNNLKKELTNVNNMQLPKSSLTGVNYDKSNQEHKFPEYHSPKKDMKMLRNY